MKNNQIFLIIFLFIGCNENSKNIIDGEPIPFRLIDKEPSWSPDEKTIVYYHMQKIDSSGQLTPDTSGLYFIDPNGANKRLLLAGFAHSPEWSPDGEWIVFEKGAQIYKIKSDGDSLTQLTFEGRNFYPAWSSDGAWISYSQSICDGENTCGIWIISIDGDQSRFIDNFGNYPTWHPIKPEVLYIRRSYTNEGYVRGDSLWYFDIQLNNKEFFIFLSGLNYDNRYIKYSPDGLKVLFLSQQEGFHTQLWIIDNHSKNKTQLTQDGSWSGDWSPDGQSIVFTNTLDGRLWIMNADGENWRQLTFNPLSTKKE